MPKKRILSEFFCRESLFDYVSDNLIPSDKDALEGALEEYPQIKEEVRHLRGALQYCQKLRMTEVKSVVFDEIEKSQSFFQVLKTKYSEAPLTIRYGAPVILIAFVSVVILRGYFPDVNSIKNTSGYVITRVGPLTKTAPVEHEISVTTPTSLAQSSNPVASPTANPAPTSAPVASHVATPVASPAAVSVTPTPLSVAATVSATPTPAPAQGEEVAKKDVQNKAGRKGFVFRTFMYTPHADDVAPKVAEKIMAMGGTKAGEVELGWKRKGGRYFHFIIPEASYDEFMSYLHGLGSVRNQKDAHARVMPEGKIRFILWIEDTSGGSQESEREQSGETPTPQSEENAPEE